MSEHTVSVILESARTIAGLSNVDLWIGYCGIGGHDSPAAVDTYLTGAALPARLEYDLLAQALNDRFIQLQLDHPVPYAEDIDPYPAVNA